MLIVTDLFHQLSLLVRAHGGARLASVRDLRGAVRDLLRQAATGMVSMVIGGRGGGGGPGAAAMVAVVSAAAVVAS